ncbi:phosphoglucosamine mutase [bacterium]|nr:phosphoglucosamine mutase [bacterium]MCI0603905.1 phosphoglucosamine mutase [bacterium]
MRKLFGTDGLRGAAGEFPLDNATVELLGRILYFLLSEKEVEPVLIVGRDTRDSGPAITSALCLGFSRAGGKIRDGGVLPTPAIAYLAKSEQNFAISVTASHNPSADNGIKIFGPDGLKLSEQTELEIEPYLLGEKSFVRETKASAGENCSLEEEFRNKYFHHLVNDFFPDLDLSGMSIVLDCANGALFHLAPAILRKMGATVHPLNTSPDGKNINHGCGSLHPEVVAEALRQNGYDCGFTFDGDGDRCLVADRNEMYDGDFILGAAARYLDSRSQLKKRSVVATSMSNLGLEVFLRNHGIFLHRVPVGDKYVLEKLKEEDLSLGGEQSGHIIFMNDSFIGDGLATALQVLRIYKNSGVPFSGIFEGIKRFPQILLNVAVKSKPDLNTVPGVPDKIRQIKDELGDSGRIVVRYSGTEMLARIMLEGADQTQIERLAAELKDVLKTQLT